MNKVDSYSISLVRVFSCISIILTHLCGQLTLIFSSGIERFILGNLTTFFCSAIFSFFFISGFLYTNAKIDNISLWYYKRFKRICIPIYIYILFDYLLISFINNDFSFSIVDFFKSAFVLFGFFHLEKQGLIIGHLWFVSYIIICYLITPLLIYYRDRHKNAFSIIFLFFLIIIHVCLFKFNSNILGIIIYVLAFIYGNKIIKNINLKNICILVIFIILINIIRIPFMLKLNNIEIFSKVYFNWIIRILILFIGILFIYVGFYLTRKYYNKLEKIKIVVNFIDPISYEIYIYHYCFLIGQLSILNVVKNLNIAIVLYFVEILIVSYIFNLINKKIIKLL